MKRKGTKTRKHIRKKKYKKNTSKATEKKHITTKA